jgi:hypothetical protein
MEVARRAFYEEGRPQDEAIASGWAALHGEYAGVDDEHWGQKRATRMGEAFVSYFERYPMDQDATQPFVSWGKAAIEFSFGIPLPVLHPETGMPIIYCGRFDMLGEQHGLLWVVDEKTTERLGETWSKRYELSSQFTGYCWGAKQHGYPVVGALIRGIGILSKEVKHIEVPFTRPQFLIDEWYETMIKDVREMVASWERTSFDLKNQWHPTVWEPNFADSCGGWSGCTFMPVCSIDPVMRERMLEINYVVRPWTPLKGDDSE